MTNWVLVSGAGTGIGHALAVKLARRGFFPVLLGRTEATLREAAADLDGVDHRILPVDITDRVALREGLAATGIKALHAVVCNAGIGGENSYGDDDRWDVILRTNLTGSYYLVNEALPYLRAGRCDGEYRHMIFVSSILARLGVPGYTAYCASKAGLLGMMRSYAVSLADEKILSNAVLPGWVSTSMARDGLQAFADATGKSYDDVFEEQMQAVPLRKMSEPREVAELIFFLLSRVQGSITGQTLDINNGALMP